MRIYGCIGKTLGHSFSREIHAKLAAYPYTLIELQEDAVAPFLSDRNFAAINVTIPYKQTVLPYLDNLSPIAQRIGAVNTIVNRRGKLYGYNTDYTGMKALIQKIGLSFDGKKVMILGTGGTGRTARVVAEDLGASTILSVSRGKTDDAISYAEAVAEHPDTAILINTTPVGMYPNCAAKPIEISAFPYLEGVVDVIYNPLRTNLVMDAVEKGIPAAGGLYMLVMQAVAAVEKFLDTTISPALGEKTYAEILGSKENIVLTGMPGSGKSTVGRLLAEKMDGYVLVDTDAEIEKRCGCSIRELMETKGEQYFRALETAILREAAEKNGRILATGGGAILRTENVRALKQNGKLYYLQTELSRLRADASRPLADTSEKLAKIYTERMDTYRQTADCLVPVMETAEEVAAYIYQTIKGETRQ